MTMTTMIKLQSGYFAYPSETIRKQEILDLDAPVVQNVIGKSLFQKNTTEAYDPEIMELFKKGKLVDAYRSFEFREAVVTKAMRLLTDKPVDWYRSQLRFSSLSDIHLRYLEEDLKSISVYDDRATYTLSHTTYTALLNANNTSRLNHNKESIEKEIRNLSSYNGREYYVARTCTPNSFVNLMYFLVNVFGERAEIGK